MVRLKASSKQNIASLEINFNSLMVRLKAIPLFIMLFAVFNFNSLMVRLKAHNTKYKIAGCQISIP